MAFCTIPFVMTWLAVLASLILVLQHLQWLIDKINSFNKTKSSCNSISWHLHVLMDLLLSSQWE